MTTVCWSSLALAVGRLHGTDWLQSHRWPHGGADKPDSLLRQRHSLLHSSPVLHDLYLASYNSASGEKTTAIPFPRLLMSLLPHRLIYK